MYDATYKVVVFGDNGVGKKAFTQRFHANLFKSDAKMSIGVDFEVKSLEINEKKVKLQIWNFGGEERFRFLVPTYLRSTEGAFYLYDVTNSNTLAHFDDWLSIIRSEASSRGNTFPIILVGNKADLQHKRQVSGEEGINIAKSRGVDGFIECSTKTGENVEEAYDALTRLMMRRSRLI
jgi:Ras-related protein Rab-1A